MQAIQRRGVQRVVNSRAARLGCWPSCWPAESEPENIRGAQFMVATRCDGGGWRRSEARCLDLVGVMPFIEGPAYYPCLEVSLEFACCVEDDAAFCQNDGPAGCSSARHALDLCF